MTIAGSEQEVKPILHITSGDMAGALLARSGVPGEVFVWHDILYDGPRKSGWPDDDILQARARFLELATGGGLKQREILDTLRAQYAKLKALDSYDSVVLWFDACLFDQSMLAHILACAKPLPAGRVELICVDAFPGIVPFHGLGQMSPAQLASVYDRRRPVTEEQFCFAERVDRAFALQDRSAFIELASCSDAPLPWIPAAVTRWLQEFPDDATGLGRIEQLALEAIRSGCNAPAEIMAAVSAKETPPQFWGDTTLWAKINALADRQPPMVRIEGPNPRLPQWEGMADLRLFQVRPVN